MRRSLLLLPTLAWAACALAATPPPPQAGAGQREFESRCAVCHGKDGRGGGPYAAQLRQAPADLTTMAARNGGVFPAGRAYEIIEGAGKGHGPRDMPVWGLDYTVQAAEVMPDLPYNQAAYVRARITALVEYLARLQAR